MEQSPLETPCSAQRDPLHTHQFRLHLAVRAVPCARQGGVPRAPQGSCGPEGPVYGGTQLAKLRIPKCGRQKQPKRSFWSIHPLQV